MRCTRYFIRDEPFAVVLGDDIVQSDTSCLRQLINQYEETHSSVIGVQTIPDDETHRYGIVELSVQVDLRGLVELENVRV